MRVIEGALVITSDIPLAAEVNQYRSLFASIHSPTTGFLTHC